MSVDKDTVRRIAHLARVQVAEEKLDALAGEMNNILDWVEQLNELDVTDVEPMTSAVETTLHWREDKVTDGNKAEDVLANAPDAEYGFFSVPKVIE